MTKLASFRRLIITFCILAIGALAVSLMNIKPQSSKSTVQAADSNLIVSSQLVDTRVSYANGEYSNAVGSTQSVVATINDGDTVVLNNADAYEVAKNNGEWTQDGENGIATQAVKFSMGTSDSSVQFALLSVSATLNGKELAIDLPGTDNTFEQFIFGLPNELYVTDTNNNQVILPETYGRFVFNYTYRISTSSGGTQQEMKGSFAFNVLTTPYLSTTNGVNAWDYNNLYKFVDEADPNYATLESATRQDQNLYFNYNNFTYDDLQTQLQMPVISYDATKYNLSYTRKIYNSLETITSEMVVNKVDDKVSAVITFTSELNGVRETFDYTIEDLNADPFVELVFEDIGEYEFTMSILTRTDDVTFLPVANADATLLNAQPTIRYMTIFGYQLKYADGQTNTAELRSVDDGLFADITHLNKDLMSKKLVAKTSSTDTSANINMGELNFFTDNDGKIVIPSTNQAPLWLDYIGTLNIDVTSQYFYYAKTSTMDYSRIEDYVPTEIGEYKKGQYFMNAGLYILEVNYTLSSLRYQHQYFKQIFAFEITNTSPMAQIIKVDDQTTLYNDGYTNQNVAVNWDTSNPFNAEIIARYDRYNFDNSLAVKDGVINKYGTDNQTILSANGKYYVKLYYGRMGTSYTSWEFTIDKDSISGLKLNFDDSLINPSVDAMNVSSINTPFTLSWNAKASGAQVSIEHQQMLLIKDDSYVVNSVDNLIYVGQDDNGNKVFALKNGYKTSSISSSITYKNITEFSVTQYALHLFRIFDEAGNELYYAILLDNTNPSFIFEPKIENKYNIIKDTTGVVWGDYKAITFTVPLNNVSKLFDSFVANDKLPSICDIENGIISVDFDSVTVHYAQRQGDLYQTELPVSSQGMQVVIDSTNQKTITAYTSSVDVVDGKIIFNNSQTPLVAPVSTDLEEFFYSVDVVDMGTTITNSTAFGKSTTQLEVNLDASQVLAFTDDNADIRLYNGSATNRDKLYVNYFSERDEFVVESLQLGFYPLAMDKTLDTYPYLDESTITVDLLETATYDSLTGKMKTDYFNLVYSSTLGREVTQAGKYVVTRTYEYNPTLFESEDDAKRTKTYTFYVDRNDIVDSITVDYPIVVDGEEVFTRLVGEYIQLVMGMNGQQQAVFNDLLLSSSDNNVILSTDLLPVSPIVPENKYSVIDESELSYTNVSSFNINLKIEFKSANEGDDAFRSVVNVSANSQSAVVNKLLQIDPKSLMRMGIYRFTLTDNAGYSQIVDNVMTNNISPNAFSFRIQVTKQLPDGTYYGTPNADGSDKEIIYSTSSSGGNVYSSSDEELKFVFEDTTDVYKAKINYTEVVVDRKTKGSTQWESAVKVTFEDATFDEDGNTIYPSSLELTSLDQVKAIREPIKLLDDLGNVVFDNDGHIVFKTDSAGNLIYKYSIILPTKNRSGAYYEGEYRVTIHYYGDEEYYMNDLGTVSYYANSINVVLDHTAPNFNLLRLVYADKYLPATSADPNVISKQDIVEYAKNLLETNPTKKEKIRQFLRSYAFALPSDFVFYKATNVDFPIGMYDDYTYAEHDTSSIYTRKYNKFSTTEEDNEQSYIKSDPEYSDVTKQRFEVANPLYKEISYGEYGTPKDPFYDTVSQETNNATGYGQEGYYEIIEIDQAGNQRIYTVYLKRSETSVVFTDDTVSQIGDALHPSLSLGYGYTVSAINNVDCYTTISLYDRTTNSVLLKKFDITPTTNIDTVISEINTLTGESSSHSSSGARYDIEFLNRFGDNFTISLQRPGEQLGYTIIEGKLNFSITLPTSTNSTWIESFIVRQYNPQTGTLQTLTHDLNGPISDTEFSGVTYTFNSGEYYFYLIDNFGRGETQPIHYIFGIIDAKDLVFSGTQIDNATASDVQFSYQTKLYTAEVYVDGVVVNDFANYNNLSVYDNQSTFIRQINFGAIPNNITSYKIILNYNTGGVDITAEPIVFVFTIDTILPTFELTDSNGNNMNYLLNNKDSSTSKEVFINWAQATNFPVTVTIKQGNGQAFEIQQGYSLYLEGTYTLTMTNTLGNSVSYTFSISQNSAILYDVYANSQKIEAGINSARYRYNGVYNDQAFDIDEYVKVFVNIYPMTVVANEKKDLQAQLIYEYVRDGVYNLKIYHIFGSSSLFYSEYIALLQIDENILNVTNFLLGETQDVMSQATGVSATYFSPEVYASWQKSLRLDVLGFEELVFENFIKVNLYYNNVFVSTFDTDNLKFTDSGEYRLYFADIAGYNYKFVSGINLKDYYTIDLLNSVSFKVNNNEPINYAIYNSNVELTITNTSRYDRGTFGMTITLNGEEIDPSELYSKTKSAYIFSKYGAYKVIMNAKINGTPIVSEYSFTILSKNEAQNRFSFNKYDSFEIVSVIKEGVDITDSLKQQQNTTKLMELNFSVDNLDNGRYVVNVRVTQSQLKPIQEFTFEFWINDAEINLVSSIPFGTSTTKVITIELNKYAIHQALGNVVIKVTGQDDVIINDETASANEVSTITLDKNQTYTIQAYTESGRLLASYMITKNEPLNTVAIIAIVLAVLAVVVTIVLFVIFRTRMKVR